MLVAAVRGWVMVVRGWGASSGAGVVVGVQVVQGQVLPAVAPCAQGQVVVMVSVGSRARVMLVGDGPRPAPLAHYHTPQLPGAGVGQGHGATPHPSACRRQVDELRFLGFQVDRELGEGPRRHLGHLLDVAPLLPAEVQELFHLPEEDTDGQEEEEAGEEDREEDKEVNVGLVLAQEQQALGFSLLLLGAQPPQGDVEAAGLQGVDLVGEGDDHTVSNATDDQHRLGFPHNDVGDEPFGPLLPHLPLCTLGFGLELKGVAGEHGTPET